MKHMFRPFALGSLGVALIGLFASQLLIVVLGLAAWLGFVAYNTIKESGIRRHDSELTAEGRALIKPLKELQNEIEKIVESFSDRPEIKVIGGEALIEADALLVHIGKLVSIQDGIVKTLRGRKEAEREIKDIEQQIAESDDGPIKEALISSAVSRKNDLLRYEAIEKTKIRITAKVKLAETALFEIKAKLAAGAIGSEPDELEQDELAGMVSRLKSLSASLDEAEEMVKDRN